MELILTTAFGLEAIAKREALRLGFDVIGVEDGHITVETGIEGIVKANLHLRTVDRVMVKVGSFEALSFDELFEGVKAMPWSEWIPVDGKFTVKGSSVKSKLFSISDSQAITKKAIVESLKLVHDIDQFPETGASYTVTVKLLRDQATLLIDTTGESLHKRGYRKDAVEAPIKETLASAMIQLSYWNEDRILIDPFCGSGTIGIEAAMIARNIAPGLYRTFVSEEWKQIPTFMWDNARREAEDMIRDYDLKIYLSDNNPTAIAATIENAKRAGVYENLVIKESDFKDLKWTDNYPVIITNPPYGERLGNQDPKLKQLYRDLGKICLDLKTGSKYIITSFGGFENLFEKKADRIRILFNGNMKARFYQYFGPNPFKK